MQDFSFSFLTSFSFDWFFFYQVIDKSFGFDTAVEEAQRAINAAHVEAESAENGIGVVKLMGRYCGKINSDMLTSSHQYFAPPLC